MARSDFDSNEVPHRSGARTGRYLYLAQLRRRLARLSANALVRASVILILLATLAIASGACGQEAPVQSNEAVLPGVNDSSATAGPVQTGPAPSGAGRAPLTPPPSPTGPESPEAALVRLSALWDAAFAQHDEEMLRLVFDPTYPGIDDEIENLRSPQNLGTPTPVSSITVESNAPGRAILAATFGYDEGPVRQRILLVDSGGSWRVAGIEDLEG